MLLNELFKPQSNGEWHTEDGYAEYSFRVGEASYTIYLQQLHVNQPDPDDNSVGELANYDFNLEGVRDVWACEFAYNEGGQGERYGVSGSGNAGEVFGNVIGALQEFKAHHRAGTALFFTAKESSRRRLYDAMIKRLGGKSQVLASKYAGGTRGYFIV